MSEKSSPQSTPKPTSNPVFRRDGVNQPPTAPRPAAPPPQGPKSAK